MHRRLVSVFAWTTLLGLSMGFARADARLPEPKGSAHVPVGRRLIGLCVGINRWANPQIPALKWAVNDAEGLAASLRAQRGLGYSSTAAITLKDAQATAKGIR